MNTVQLIRPAQLTLMAVSEMCADAVVVVEADALNPVWNVHVDGFEAQMLSQSSPGVEAGTDCCAFPSS